MLPDRVSNPGPLTYESGALPIALRGPAGPFGRSLFWQICDFLKIKNFCSRHMGNFSQSHGEYSN